MRTCTKINGSEELVFKDPTVNAWAYPNGTVAVQTGLLAAMENEAQLAAIMGHEISHYLNRHAFIQIKSRQTQSLIGTGQGDGFFGSIMGKDYAGHIAASAIRIAITDRAGKTVYYWSGGVEVMMQRNGDKLEPPAHRKPVAG